VKRSKKVVFLSHCILNQNTVVPPLARASGPYRDIVEIISRCGIGMHQLPCPEFRYLGLKRKPMSKEEYDTFDFRKLCRDIAKDTVVIMKEYLDNDYNIVGLIGINESPTCSFEGNKGIFVEELFVLCEQWNINLKILDVPTTYHDGKEECEFKARLKKFMGGVS